MKRHSEVFSMLGLIGQIGVVMIVSIFIATAVGIWIGDKISSDVPAVAGFFVGAAAGVTGVYRIVARYIKRTDPKLEKSDDTRFTAS